MYQVTKKECLDLPPKTYSNSYFYFDDKQYEVYQSIKNYYVNMIDYEEFNGEYILNMINDLYRVASGYIDVNLKIPIEIICKYFFAGFNIC